MAANTLMEVKAGVVSLEEWNPTPSLPKTLEDWPSPKPLPSELAPVAPLDFALLPNTVAPWISDIAERMQCPPDFVAIAALVAAASVIGRQVGIRPQQFTDWTVVPNLWGMAIGRPGVMKSPAIEAALAPVRRLEAMAGEQHQTALAAYQFEARAY